ncbi:MAG: hypothetical protein KDI09_06535, partial [Halioglobus sp.]|nr:hypothetical protein [Halioglobus sp.]
VFVMNKADREGVEETLRQFELMLHLRAEAAGADGSDWSPPVLRAVASREEGMADIVDATDAHAHALRASGEFAQRSGRRARSQALAILTDAVQRLLLERADAEILAAVEARHLDPYSAAEQLLLRLREA